MFKKLFKILTPRERKQAFFLIVLMMIMGFLDTIGVASIMPFMAVLGNPEVVESNSLLNKAFAIVYNLGIQSVDQFLFFLGVLVFLLLLVSLSFKTLVTYSQVRFTQMREYSLSKRLIEGYLHQPYSWFLNRNSADLGKTILSEVSQVSSVGISPLMNLIANGVIAIFLLSLLIIVNPQLAITVGLILLLSYGLVYKLSQKALRESGEQRYKSNQERFTATSEAFGAIKEIKIGILEKIFINRFSKPALTYARSQTKSQVIGQLPRFALEAIAFGGLLLIILNFMVSGRDFSSILPTLALYAFTGYRLMPALQAIYAAATRFRHATPSIEALYKDLSNLCLSNVTESGQAIQLTKAITLNQVHYNYPNTKKSAIKDISLTIPANNMVGFVGKTGSGKTTTIDLILGLLDIQAGSLEVDGQIITKHNRSSWQQGIGYVPQNIYLSDSTIAENIAFGLDPKQFDYEAIIRAAKIAKIHDFITEELPEQYQTKVGERGVRLSGGQIQRIGIARALYHKPQVLIFDEATSALDNLTEESLMREVYAFSDKMTIILIAHRLSTVKSCDTIFILEKGRLVDQGNYSELIKSSDIFKEMIGAQF